MPAELPSQYYCATRDIFQARLDNMVNDLLVSKKIGDGNAYMISAIAGEIGNNSFDHNIGSWPDVAGIFFGYQFAGDILSVVLADRGLGIRATLSRIKPGIVDDQEALKVAFFERISGRAPESRGNGLKFVRENIKERNMHLKFVSGDAQILANQETEIKPFGQKIHGCLAIIDLKI